MSANRYPGPDWLVSPLPPSGPIRLLHLFGCSVSLPGWFDASPRSRVQRLRRAYCFDPICLVLMGLSYLCPLSESGAYLFLLCRVDLSGPRSRNTQRHSCSGHSRIPHLSRAPLGIFSFYTPNRPFHPAANYKYSDSYADAASSTTAHRESLGTRTTPTVVLTSLETSRRLQVVLERLAFHAFYFYDCPVL